MRSRVEAGLLALAMAATLVTAAPSMAAARLQHEPVQRPAASPTQADIARALKIVKEDPNLATERTIKMLQWKDSGEEKRAGTPAWVEWIAGLFRWLDQSARYLMWSATVMLAGFLVVYVVRMVRRHRHPGRDEPFVAPTHVGDLDIRPETLPDDIGASAQLLWERGEHRAALALLYRGMLSRLTHVHRVPIRDSSTEGDCLELAARHLPPARGEYASRLVGVWRRAVYGREEVQAATVHVLCDEFAAALDRGAPIDSLQPRGSL